MTNNMGQGQRTASSGGLTGTCEHYQTLVNYARIVYHKKDLYAAYDILMQMPEEKRKVDAQYYNLRGLLSMAGEDYLSAAGLAAGIKKQSHYT